MLVRLVGKLLLKACIPLILIAGVMTYGVYLKGGNPTQLWGHVAGGAFDKAGTMFTKAKSDVAGIAGNLAQTANNAPYSGVQAGHTHVFKWVDAAGVTHFSSTDPQGVNTQRISVDPNTNVLAPVAPPVVLRDERSTGEQRTESQTGEPVPGVAGQLLSGGAAEKNGRDAAQLIRLLQSTGQ